MYGLKIYQNKLARELNRNSTKDYASEVAQDKYVERRKDCKPKGKWSASLAGVIEEKLLLTWFPEQIVGWLQELHLSFKNI